MERRIGWSLLTIALLLSMFLGACGGQATETTVESTVPPPPEETEAPTEAPPPEPAVSLVIWADETRSPAIREIGAQFGDDYGVEFVVQEMGFGDIRDQLAVAGPAGEGPDIIIGAHDWLGQLVTNGLVASIDLGAKEAEFFEGALTAFTYDGQLYGMPYATENIAFFCNPDIVDAPPETWDDVMTLAGQLETESGGEVTAWTIQTVDPYHYFPLMSSFGGYVFGLTEQGYDASDVGLDNAGAVEAATWLEGMAEADYVDPDVDYDVLHTLFTEGRVACIGTGPWALGMIRDSGVSYTINPFPAGSAGEGRPFLGVQGFMVSAFSENQLLAQTILTEVFATPEFMQAMYDADPRPSAFLSVRDATDDPDLAAFAAAGAEGLPMPGIPEMSSVWEAWGNAQQLTITEQLSGQEAFTDAAEQVRNLIAE